MTASAHGSAIQGTHHDIDEKAAPRFMNQSVSSSDT